MRKDAEVNRNTAPDAEQQTALAVVEDFLRNIPYLAMKLSKDEIVERFGEKWENILKTFEEQDISVESCDVYEYKPSKCILLDAYEEKKGCFFKPKLNNEGEILNPILRERYNVAKAQVDEFAPTGWILRANLPESKMANVLGKEWRMVLYILKTERNFKVKHYKVWRRYGFLRLRKEFVEWKYLITAPENEYAKS